MLEISKPILPASEGYKKISKHSTLTQNKCRVIRENLVKKGVLKEIQNHDKSKKKTYVSNELLKERRNHYD